MVSDGHPAGADAAGGSGGDPTGSRMGGGSHEELLREAFTRQAPIFEDPRRNRLFTLDADWLFAHLPLGGEELLLDVAAGTGHAARALAGRVHAAVAVDVTGAMLEAGRAQAEAAGIANLVFMRGDAVALPFLDGSFDVALTRFALHHMEDPGAAIGELARCLRPGGILAVADMVSHEDPTLAEAQNRLERRRDPSHTRMLSASELCQDLLEVGIEDPAIELREIERPMAPWLEQSGAGPAVAREIEAALRAELAGGPATGLGPCTQGGELRFVQVWASAWGRVG